MKKRFQMTMACRIWVNMMAKETNLMNDMDLDEQSYRTVILTKVIMKMESDMAKELIGNQNIGI